MSEGAAHHGHKKIKLERATSWLLMALGLLTLATGLHFVLLRPPMLPEDVRFTGMAPNLLRPEMLQWLRIIFQTWGGFLAGFGILIVSVAGCLLTSRIAILKAGTSLAVLVAFSRFLASNVLIHSDFIIFVGTLFVFAAVAALMLRFDVCPTASALPAGGSWPTSLQRSVARPRRNGGIPAND